MDLPADRARSGLTSGVDDVLLALSTFPDAPTAERIARTLVNEKLAACANMTAPVRSIYRWQGNVEEAAEILVFFKTTAAVWEKFAARLRELHPYETPEIIALPITRGLPEYLRWVGESCA
ncbi:MAG: divalent-cation tolerance protein CutA [Verrucomicrobiota bacterium]|nr:divalent-cation tolerance protein CutA [Verrucomicrobiota bacterium]